MDAGLFNLALVKAVGGDEGHPVLQMEVYEAIATIFPKKTSHRRGRPGRTPRQGPQLGWRLAQRKG